MEPLAFALLKSLTPDDVTTVFYDERTTPIPFDEDTDAVALSITTFAAQRAYQIAGRFKERGIPVVAGGFHPTLCPDEAARFVDCVVIGDAEDTWPCIVADLKKNALRKRYSSRFPSLTDTIPDRTVFNTSRYVPVRPVQFGRGCPYQCDFCSIHAFYGTSLRQRPLANIVEELHSRPRRHILFTDDNLLQNKTSFDALLSDLGNMDIRWSCQISLNAAADPRVPEQMAGCGCTSVTVGFESLDANNLRQMGKTVNEHHMDYGRAIRAFNEAGIMVYGCFVFGYDFDTIDSFKRTLDFALENHLFLANFIPLTPMPGTALHTRLKKEGRLINDPWWLDPGYRYGNASFLPLRMSPQELEEGIYFLRGEFNTFRNIAKRLTGDKANRLNLYNAGVFMASNLASRKEIHRKQDSALYSSDDPFPEASDP